MSSPYWTVPNQLDSFGSLASEAFCSVVHKFVMLEQWLSFSQLEQCRPMTVSRAQFTMLRLVIISLFCSSIVAQSGFPESQNNCHQTLDGTQLRKNVYTVGVLAIRGFEAAHDEFNTTFADYLTATAGKRFDPPIQFKMKPLNFLTLFSDSEARLVDFIYVNPSAFSCIESEYGARSLTSQISRRVIEGRTYHLKRFGGVIVTRADRDDISTIFDLKDKVIAAASISGLGSGQMQFREMQESNMSYINDPKQLVFTSNQGKVVKGVLNREFDVGFVRTDQLERSKDAEGNPIDTSLFKIIDPKPSLHIDQEPFPFESSTQLYPESDDRRHLQQCQQSLQRESLCEPTRRT